MKRFAYGQHPCYEYLDLQDGADPPATHMGLAFSHEAFCREHHMAELGPGFNLGIKQIHRACNSADLHEAEYEFQRPRKELQGKSYEDLARTDPAVKTYGCSRWV